MHNGHNPIQAVKCQKGFKCVKCQVTIKGNFWAFAATSFTTTWTLNQIRNQKQNHKKFTNSANILKVL